MIHPDLTPLGMLIRDEIAAIPAHHPEMCSHRYVTMPDHIHFILQVRTRLKRMLGYELAGFFGARRRHSNPQS